MAVTTTEKFYLDLNANNIININAKQLDNRSRFINIICTDHGKKVNLESTSMSAFVRWKKSDDKNVFKMCEILDDGSVLVELSQQMLLSSGMQVADIMITESVISTVETVEDLDALLKNNKVVIISTMKFNVNVVSAPFEADELVSDDEITALTDSISKFQSEYTKVLNSIELCNENAEEAKKQANEAKSAAQSANSAANAANTELLNMQELIGSVDDDETKNTLYGVKKACEKAIELAKEATNKAETVANTATTLIGSKEDTSEDNTVYGVMNSAQDIIDNYKETIDNCVKKTGDTMTGDLTTPNVKATNSMYIGNSKFTYDNDSASVVISFLDTSVTE